MSIFSRWRAIAPTSAIVVAHDAPMVAADVAMLNYLRGPEPYDEIHARAIYVVRGVIIDGIRPPGHWDAVRRAVTRELADRIA